MCESGLGYWKVLQTYISDTFHFFRFLIDLSGTEENPVRLATTKMGEMYKESGTETNSLKSFSDRVQEELEVFYNKVDL